METYWLVVVAVCILALAVVVVWLALSLRKLSTKPKLTPDIVNQADASVDRVFDDEFREELRNRGRLHFEKIINENAMFLKQDLQLTASQLNEYMQDSIKKVLKDEFAKYEKSIEGAKNIAIEAIEKTQQTLEQQRVALERQLQEEVGLEKKRIIEKFETNMNQVINHYLLEAIGNEIDMTDQMDYIFRRLEDNKQAIIEDIRGDA